MTTNTTQRCFALLLVSALTVGTMSANGGGRRFYPDDPLISEAEDRDASRVKSQEAGSSYIGAQLIHSTAVRSSRRAGNVNAIDEVPDSGWYTNRLASTMQSIEAIRRGPDTSVERPHGPWT